MSRAIPQALDGLNYFGRNNYTYSGSHNYTYTGPSNYFRPIESYGFDGFPGNPMLSAAITATRGALLRNLLPPQVGGEGDIGLRRIGASASDGLPKPNQPEGVSRYAGQVRASLAQMELLASVGFNFDEKTGEAKLLGRSGSGWLPLATMKRPDRAYFMEQLGLVRSLATQRDSRGGEVLTQVAPPFAYFASVLNLQAGQHQKTMEILNVLLQATYAICQRFKHTLACPRPSEYSTTVQPMIEVPMHLTLPAGHATEAHLTAAVLGALAGIGKGETSDLYLRRLAHRIAENRVVAGLHFPVDNLAGRLLGDALSSYFLALCGYGEMTWTGGSFDGTQKNEVPPGSAQPIESDPRFGGILCNEIAESRNVPVSKGPGGSPLLPVVHQMWDEAKRDWQ